MPPTSEVSRELPTVLQRVIVHRPTEIRDLYWKYKSNNAAARQTAFAQSTSDGHLILGAGTQVSFNTYFNSFYETYWHLHANVGTIFLRLVLDGSMRLRIHRDLGEADRLLLHEDTLDSGTHII